MTLRYFAAHADRLALSEVQMLGRLACASGLTETAWRLPLLPGDPLHHTLRKKIEFLVICREHAPPGAESCQVELPGEHGCPQCGKLLQQVDGVTVPKLWWERHCAAFKVQL